MIGKLSGRLDSSGEGWAMIDVGGVGYIAFCSGRTLARLPQPGEAARLWIETHVREDHIHLYGFIETAERDWFRLLCTVQGVGAKMALAILSVLGPGELLQAIAAQDKAALTRASGVGPKLAQRIVTELKDKVGKIELGAAANLNAALGGATVQDLDGVPEDAVQALVGLGYKRSEAFSAVARAARDLGEGAKLELVIKAGLKVLAS